MNKSLWFSLVVFVSVLSLQAQDISARVTVDASRIGQSNKQVFEELNKSLNEFVNSTNWTSRRLSSMEKIKANFYLNISEYENNNFKASLQIQYSRPVYDAIYQSPVLIIKDNDLAFNYTAFAPLVLNKNNLDSNLVAVFAYYIYFMMGLDADSFALKGGTNFYNEAQSIADLARSQNFSGWSSSSTAASRSRYAQDILSNSYSEYRMALYQYHRLGLDLMTNDASNSKEAMAQAINRFVPIFNRDSSSPLIKLFFDAKAQEISSIFSQGPDVKTKTLKSNLVRMAPLFSNTWNSIK
jgi:hypothetical protein